MTTGSFIQVRELPLVRDARGSLSFAEYDKHLPFIPKRYFLVFDVPAGEVRGGHAHRRVHQFLVCIRGSCRLTADDGRNCQEILLNRVDCGAYLPPLVWSAQNYCSPDAVLLVLCSDVYDPDEYITDYDEFKSITGAG